MRCVHICDIIPGYLSSTVYLQQQQQYKKQHRQQNSSLRSKNPLQSKENRESMRLTVGSALHTEHQRV